jgi:hypothetical protein
MEKPGTMAKKKKTQPEPDQNKPEPDDNERRMEHSDHEASAVQRATLPKKKKTQPEPDQNKPETDDNGSRMERSDHEAIARRGFPAAVQRAALPGCPKCGHRQEKPLTVGVNTQSYAGLIEGENGEQREYHQIVWKRIMCSQCKQIFIHKYYV